LKYISVFLYVFRRRPVTQAVEYPRYISRN